MEMKVGFGVIPKRRFPFWKIVSDALASAARWAQGRETYEAIENAYFGKKVDPPAVDDGEAIEDAGQAKITSHRAGADVNAGDLVGLRSDGKVEPANNTEPVPAPAHETAEEFARKLDVAIRQRVEIPSGVERPSDFALAGFTVHPTIAQRLALTRIAQCDRVVVTHGHKAGATMLAVFAALRFGRKNSVAVISGSSIGLVDLRHFIKLESEACPALLDNIRIAWTDDEGNPSDARVNATIEKIAGTDLVIIEHAETVPAKVLEAALGCRRVLVIGIPVHLADPHIEGNNAVELALSMAYAYGTFARTWVHHRLSSTDSPNVTGDGPAIKGLATPEYIAEKKREWGESSELYRARILGLHPSEAENKIDALKAAKMLADTGLLFEINRRVLHPLGLAMVFKQHDNGRIEFASLSDVRDSAESGIEFVPEALAEGAAKLEAYMAERGRAAITARVAKLGYVAQPGSVLIRTVVLPN